MRRFVLFFLSLLLVAGPSADVLAAKRKLSRADYEKQQKELQKQIAATEKMISANDQSVRSQNRDIKIREDEISKRRQMLQTMQLELEAMRQEEDSLKVAIKRLTSDYDVRKERYASAVRHIFRWRSGVDEWLFVVSAKDFAEGIRRVRFLQQYSSWRKQEAQVLLEKRQATVKAQQDLIAVKNDHAQLMGNIEVERQNLARKQQQQEAAVADLKKRNSELKSELASAQQKQREIQRAIQKMIEEERKKAAAARKESANKDKKGGSSSGTAKPSGKNNSNAATYSPSVVDQLTGSFRQNKGKMPYPVDSNYAFLSHYTNDGNYCITLSTSVGAHARSIFEGTVIRTERSSEDWTVIIGHGEYMSVFSNLGDCSVREGQKVTMNQTIGTVKSDVDGRRAQLMFWISGKNNFENPEAWLRR